MAETVISIEQLGKLYRLGEVGTGSLAHDVNRWWHRVRGKEDPYAKVGEENHRDSEGKSGYVWALRDVTFQVGRGEVVGLVGRNGAGKSTLLKILSRITTPSAGSIKLKGRVASLLEVGTGFHPELTGRENIFLNGAILGMSRQETRAKLDEIIEFSGCARYIDTPVKRYSSGMYVRLAFAVAAHLDSEILIVDEVLAVGDLEFQKRCLGRMRNISESGRTVLFVSHNLGALRGICDTGVVLEAGTVRAQGTIDQAIRAYVGQGDALNHRYEAAHDPAHPYFGVVEVSQPGVARGERFKCSEPIAIRCELGGLNGKPLFVSAEIRDEEGAMILHAGEQYMNQSSAGLQTRTAVIAANALSEQTYTLNLFLYEDKGPLHDRVESRLSFSTYLDNCLSPTSLWRGILAPSIVQWS